MSRHVIRNAAGNLFTGNSVPRTDYIPRAGDPSRTDPVMRLQPLFETVLPMFAVKYDTASDAAAMLSHPDLADPNAFDGCTVREVEFDSLNPQAVR
jgi:hypothetical protein